MFTSALRRAEAISVKISGNTFSSMTGASLTFLRAYVIFYPNSANTIIEVINKKIINIILFLTWIK